MLNYKQSTLTMMLAIGLPFSITAAPTTAERNNEILIWALLLLIVIAMSIWVLFTMRKMSKKALLINLVHVTAMAVVHIYYFTSLYNPDIPENHVPLNFSLKAIPFLVIFYGSLVISLVKLVLKFRRKEED